MIQFTGRTSDFLKIGVKAAERGDLSAVQEILSQKPEWLTRIGSHGRTLLWAASHKGKLDVVRYLVEKGADINASGTHYTPYYVEISCYCIAQFKKHVLVADYLLKQGAEYTIHAAAFLGELHRVKSFIEGDSSLLHAAKPQYEMAGKNDQGLEFILAPSPWATPLCYALRGQDELTVTWLIENGAKIKGFEKQLFIAADDHPEMVELLLKNGASHEFAPRALPTDVKLYEVLSSFGIEPPDSESLSEELVYLCRGDRGGDLEEVRVLLDNGANVNHQDKKGKTALHRAARSGFIKTMEVLLSKGASVRLEDKVGEIALFEPIRSTIKNQENRIRAYKLLLANNSDISHQNHKGETIEDVAGKLDLDWEL